jgi:hypothetical protein
MTSRPESAIANSDAVIARELISAIARPTLLMRMWMILRLWLNRRHHCIANR